MRKISQVLRGKTLPEPPVKVWDATPTGGVVPATFNVVESVGLLVDSQTNVVTLDVANFTSQGPYSSAIGVAKTSLTTSFITVGGSARFGYSIEGMPASLSEVTEIGMVLAPSTMSAQDVLTAFSTNTPLGNNVTLFDVAFGANKQSSFSATIPDTVMPAGNSKNSSIASQLIDITTGRRSLLVIGRTAATMSFAMVAVTQDGTGYDILSELDYDDNPTVPDLSVFLLVASLDAGNGFNPVAIRPRLDVSAPAYAVTGLTANTQGGVTQQQWDAHFPGTPIQPAVINLTQASFPAKTFVGDLLKVFISNTYTFPTPVTPYGITVTNGLQLRVDNIDTGAEGFTILPNQESLNTQMSALSTAIQQSVTAQLTVYDVKLNRVQESKQEVVVYAKAAPASGAVSTPLVGQAVFPNFDAAYEYLITLPVTVPKRIVFDDRDFVGSGNGEQYSLPSDIGYIQPTKTYALFANNIKLSTYKAFNDRSLNNDSLKVGTGFTYFYFNQTCDGLMLDHFVGEIRWNVQAASGDGKLFTTSDTITPAWTNHVYAGDKTWIGEGCNLIINKALKLDDNGGTIRVGKNSYVYCSFSKTAGNVAPMTAPVVIDLADTSTVEFSIVEADMLNDNVDPTISCIEVNYFEDAAKVIYDQTALDGIGRYTYIQRKQLYKAFKTLYPNATLVRKLSDLSTTQIDVFSYQIKAGKYIIVGDVDIGPNQLVPYTLIGQSVDVFGLPGSSLRADNMIFWAPNGATLSFKDITLKNGGSLPTVLNGLNGQTEFKRVFFDTPYPFDLTAGGNTIIKDIEIQNLANPLKLGINGNLSVDGVRGTLSDTFLFDVYMNSGYGQLSISNVDVYSTLSADQPGVIDFNNVYTPGVVQIFPKLKLSNVSVRPTGASIYKFQSLISIAGVPYDHTADSAIEVSQATSFYRLSTEGTTDSIIVQQNIPAEPTFQAGGLIRYARGFTISPFSKLTTKKITPFKQWFDFEVEMDVKVPVLGANVDLSFDFGIDNVFTTRVVATDTAQTYHVRLRRQVLLDTGSELIFTITNVDNASNVELTNIYATLTQV